MSEKNSIEILLSKAKLTKLLIFSILFLIGGLWMIIKQPQTSNVFFNGAIIKFIAGYGSTVMGLLGLYFFSRKLMQKKPGLLFNEKGITGNATAFSFGLIPWNDISGIYDRSIQVSIFSKQRFITIELNNPEPYISREANFIKKRLLILNLKSYGSPIHISTNELEIDHNDLMRLLKQKLTAMQPPTQKLP